MSDGFELKFDFVERWGRVARPEHLQIYIYLLSCYKKDGSILSNENIAKRLHISADDVSAALDFWVTSGILCETDDGYTFPEDSTCIQPAKKKETAASRFRTRPSYAAAEIDAAVSLNKNIGYLSVF